MESLLNGIHIFHIFIDIVGLTNIIVLIFPASKTLFIHELKQ